MTAADEMSLSVLDTNIAMLKEKLAAWQQERLDLYRERGIVPPEFAGEIEALRLGAISKETVRVMRGGAIGTFFSNAVSAAPMRNGLIVRFSRDGMKSIRATWVEEDGGVAAKNEEIAALEAKFAARYGTLTGAHTSHVMLPAPLSWLDEISGGFPAPQEKEEKAPIAQSPPEEPARKIRFREFL